MFATARWPDSSIHGRDALTLEVTSDDSFTAAATTAKERTGRVDAIVNNAGVDMVGAVDERTIGQALALFQTSFVDVHRFLPMPFNAFYSASTHALEGHIESLACDVTLFGVRSNKAWMPSRARACGSRNGVCVRPRRVRTYARPSQIHSR